MRRSISSTITAAYTRQKGLRAGDDPLYDELAYQSRGRFSEPETDALLRSVGEIAQPFDGLAKVVADAVLFNDAGLNYTWPSYRAAAVAPTDLGHALAFSWRFTAPYRETIVAEVENIWVCSSAGPLEIPEPRPECEPIIEGITALMVGATTILWMNNGIFSAAAIERSLRPTVENDGGHELLTSAEKTLLTQVVRALATRDRTVLEEVNALGDDDLSRWIQGHGEYGDVHFVVPPGDTAQWDMSVRKLDTSPGLSVVTLRMWTREEGPSDLRLEIEIATDHASGRSTGRFQSIDVW